MLYTKKGDDGTTKTFGCDQRVSKSSSVAEALGSLDEINSYLGLCKVKSVESQLKVGGDSFGKIVHILQENLFMVQAELAGADKHIEEGKVKQVEDWIDLAEHEMPPIKTFFISGGSDIAATFDVARTIARRAERRVVGVNEEGLVKLGAETLKFMNRLSSILYALARLSNHKSGIKETAPSYN
ncbi:MAG: cob(I)yrinic acid a,c-diamide adenosyltransferase [Minisyncoccia bacterium]